MKANRDDFYMFYRMRTSMTLSVKGTVGGPHFVKVVISDRTRMFEKAFIWESHKRLPDVAMNEVMNMLLNIEDWYLMAATEEELLEWDKL